MANFTISENALHDVSGFGPGFDTRVEKIRGEVRIAKNGRDSAKHAQTKRKD